MTPGTTQLQTLLDGYVNRNKDLRGISNCIQETPPEQVLRQLLSITDKSGRTAVHKAIEGGATVRLSYLIGQLDVNQSHELLKSRDHCGDSPLHYAAKKDCCDTFDMLLKLQSGESTFDLLRMQNESGMIALHVAAMKGYDAAMESMLRKLKKPRRIYQLFQIRNAQGHTPVFEALRAGKTKTAQCMLKYLASAAIPALLKMGDLRSVIIKGQEKVIISLSELLDSSQFVELMVKKNGTNESLVHLAMSLGRTEMVTAMLNVRDTQENDKKCMAMLGDLDVDANTPVHHAAAAGQTRVLEHAMSFLNADQKQQILEKRNRKGHTAIQIACINQHAKTAQALHDYISTPDTEPEETPDVEMNQPAGSQVTQPNDESAAVGASLGVLRDIQNTTNNKLDTTALQITKLSTDLANLSQRVSDLEENAVRKKVPTGGQQPTDGLSHPIMEEEIPNNFDENNMEFE